MLVDTILPPPPLHPYWCLYLLGMSDVSKEQRTESTDYLLTVQWDGRISTITKLQLSVALL